MIQDIFPAVFSNHYEALTPSAEDRAVVFREGKLLIRYDEENARLYFPPCGAFAPAGSAVYLFSVNRDRFFLIRDAIGVPVPAGYAWYTLQEVRRWKRRCNPDAFAAFTAYHLWKWYEESRFCGACGARTEIDSQERAMVCPACGRKIYPRINPAVIVGVINGEKLLLTRYNTGYAHNALVAGFAEIGETLEETVRREVMEEVGLRVKNIRYYKSQPWGVAADLLAGFFCEVDGDDRIRRDEHELKYASWVERQKIELQPTDDSLTNEMMRMFQEGRVRAL